VSNQPPLPTGPARRGAQYRIQVSALAHNVFEEPTQLTFETWITQQPAGRYRVGE
jgi:hypothetical protein